MYEGYADWDIIKQVKQTMDAPVIGNGDIDSPQLAKVWMLFGRAALVNPWIIYQVVKYLETGELMTSPTPKEKIDVCMLHMERLIKLKGEKIAIMEMRKHAAYLKGLKGNAKVRRKINETETRESLVNILYSFAEELEVNNKAS